MRLVGRYIFKEWAVAFGLTLSVVIGLVILQSIYDSLPELLENGAGPREILLYFGLRIPGFIPAVLPIVFLVSILLSLGTLHRNNEITAMRAAGLSLRQIVWPIGLVGVVLSGTLFYLTADLVPRTVEQSRMLYEQLEFSAREAVVEDVREVGLVFNLAFDNPAEDRLWFMNRFSERAWIGLGVSVHTRDRDGRETHRVTAREAYFDESLGHWVFLEGRELILDAATGDPLQLRSFDRADFPAFTEDPSLMLTLYKRPKDLSLFQLRKVLALVTPEDNPNIQAYRMRYFTLLAAPFSAFVVVGIAVPFAVSGVRTNPMVGVAKCVGWFFLFYLLISVTTILGNRALLEPPVAAWIPNAVMLAAGCVLLWRSR